MNEKEKQIERKAKIQLAICCAIDACQILSKSEKLASYTREDLAKYAKMLSEANAELKYLS